MHREITKVAVVGGWRGDPLEGHVGAKTPSPTRLPTRLPTPLIRTLLSGPFGPSSNRPHELFGWRGGVGVGRGDRDDSTATLATDLYLAKKGSMFSLLIRDWSNLRCGYKARFVQLLGGVNNSRPVKESGRNDVVNGGLVTLGRTAVQRQGYAMHGYGTALAMQC